MMGGGGHATMAGEKCSTKVECFALPYVIVFVWSQYDGGNIEQRTIGYGCRQNQEAKLKNCGRSNSLIQLSRS